MNRKFVVNYNGVLSREYCVKSGVPQGSNLGPLLFVLFINDLPNVIKYSDCLMYADDVKIFKEIKNVRDCVQLQKDINSIFKWSISNKLLFNIKKCCHMSLTLNKHTIAFEYQMSNEVLLKKYSIKDLGITYTNTLSFKEHFQLLVKSANQMMGFLMRNTYSFENIKILKILFYALVRSKLDFGAIVWLAQPQVYLQELEKIQNKFLRFLYYKKYKQWPNYETVRTTRLRDEFKILSINIRHQVMLLIFLYKIINSAINNAALLSLLPFNVPRQNARIFPLFRIPLCTTTTTARSPLITMLRLANLVNQSFSLEFDVCVRKYKNKLVKYFLNTSL